jgi:hypothetical protein
VCRRQVESAVVAAVHVQRRRPEHCNGG